MRAILVALGVILTVGCSEADLALDDVRGPQAFGAPMAGSDSVSCLDEAGSLRDANKRAFFVEDCVRRLRIVGELAPVAAQFSMLHMLLPEYHDEQRLLDTKDRFGPMTLIYASPHLWGFVRRWQVWEHGDPGILSAVIFVDTAKGATLPPSYTRLHLEAGLNCLWLSVSNQPEARWRASMSHPTLSGEACHPRQAGRPLAVVATEDADVAHSADYPPVARFTEDSTGLPLIGVRCVVGWCDIGPQGDESGRAAFVPRTARIATSAAGVVTEAFIAPTAPREQRVKGWNDEQLLAVGQGATIRPSNIRALLVPERGLDVRDTTFYVGDFRKVATVYLSRDPIGTQYHTWGLRAGANEIDLRREPGGWVVRVRPADGTPPTRWTHVKRHTHPDAAVPGTARFRWTSYDDGIWIPCGQGCCRADGA